jgi:cardiolipin synthase (CMP-forming)
VAVGTQASVRTMLTIPNALSVVRLLGIPLFLWLLLGPHADAWAFLVIGMSGFTDWLDGTLARALKQTSPVGALLDPLVDRLYIVAVVVALSARGVLPLWLGAAILAREAVLSLWLPLLYRRGYGPLPVHFVGKAATLNLLCGLPLLLLAIVDSPLAETARVIGWAFIGWGTALYWWAGVLYSIQAYHLVRGGRAPDRNGAARAPGPDETQDVTGRSAG